MVPDSPRPAAEIYRKYKYMDLKCYHTAVTWPVSAFHDGRDIQAAC